VLEVRGTSSLLRFDQLPDPVFSNLKKMEFLALSPCLPDCRANLTPSDARPEFFDLVTSHPPLPDTIKGEFPLKVCGFRIFVHALLKAR